MRRRTLLIALASVVAVLALAAGAWSLGSVSGPVSGPEAGRGMAVKSPAPAPVPKAEDMPPMTLTGDTRYVALGDSFAAGMGAGDEHGGCVRSAESSYPAVFAADTGVRLLHNAACSGATTDDLVNKQLWALNGDVDLVSVSIGGNDLGVAALATACEHGPTTECKNDFNKAVDTIGVLTDRLSATYQAIAEAAPNARIVVTGYPLLFELPATNNPEFATTAAVNTATAALDADAESAVTRQQERGVKIWYVPVSFTNHGVGSAKPWVNRKGLAAYHPTAAGYREYARAFEAALAGRH
ncbi:SGNH/GDSL hydrolase family protein [Diaminobutyricibacter tongyongensis]|uniref:SGNH/GDSL hydrolase family protein n=1 Tax=Leifsonia tongyongensis TaxID=1268043 RepID=A0A6L9Y0G6_9MICO|nr:SGNH/GDSL hydrolase family protein [Diaminobutyricibacter tongyongensis]NEN06768.1 SGNH/GDSL hydrolase family protein [Diaminobutyricibacter tongyongensis]